MRVTLLTHLFQKLIETNRQGLVGVPTSLMLLNEKRDFFFFFFSQCGRVAKLLRSEIRLQQLCDLREVI